MKVNIVLLGSPFLVSVTLPENCSFIGWVKNVKADGGIFADQMHIPYDKIIGMGVEGAIEFNQPVPTAPSTDTKQ